MDENKTVSPTPETPAPAAPKKVRRVGRVAFALVLIASGVLLLINQFVPDFDLLAIVRFAPVILIVLGVEMLIYSAQPNVKLKFDWLSVLGSAFILCVVGVASLIPYFWDTMGPQAEAARDRYRNQLEDKAYQALNADTDLKAKVNSLDFYVDFNYLEADDYTLQDGDDVYMNVTLPESGYVSAQDFANDCWSIFQLMEQAGVPVTEYYFNSNASYDASTNAYSLDFPASYAEGLTAEQLALRVQTQYQFDGDFSPSQADRDNAVKDVLREEVIGEYSDEHDGEYPGDEYVEQEVERRFQGYFPALEQPATAETAATASDSAA